MATISIHQHDDGKVTTELKYRRRENGSEYTVMTVSVTGFDRGEIDLYFLGLGIEELKQMRDEINDYLAKHAGVDVYA